MRSSIKQELKGAEDLEGLLAAIEDSGAIQNAADEFVRADIDVYYCNGPLSLICARACVRARAPAGVRACVRACVLFLIPLLGTHNCLLLS